MSFSVQILGAKDVMDAIRKNSIEKLPLVNDAIHKSGFIVEDEVKQSISGNKEEDRSVDTGRFLNSVSTNNEVFLESEITSGVEYAKFLEYGTSKIAPRRHFGNSLIRKTEDIKNKIKEAIK